MQKLIEDLEKNFVDARTPGADLVIDESQMAWRGRLVFRQYNPGKGNKYGFQVLNKTRF